MADKAKLPGRWKHYRKIYDDCGAGRFQLRFYEITTISGNNSIWYLTHGNLIDEIHRIVKTLEKYENTHVVRRPLMTNTSETLNNIAHICLGDERVKVVWDIYHDEEFMIRHMEPQEIMKTLNKGLK